MSKLKVHTLCIGAPHWDFDTANCVGFCTDKRIPAERLTSDPKKVTCKSCLKYEEPHLETGRR